MCDISLYDADEFDCLGKYLVNYGPWTTGCESLVYGNNTLNCENQKIIVIVISEKKIRTYKTQFKCDCLIDNRVTNRFSCFLTSNRRLILFSDKRTILLIRLKRFYLFDKRLISRPLCNLSQFFKFIF